MNWLKKYINHKGISVLYFEKSVGTRSTIDKAIKNGSNLRSDILAKIVETYDDINPKWLLTGKGNMLIDDNVKENFNKSLDLPGLLNYLFDHNKALMNDKSFRDYIAMNANQLHLKKAIEENDENLEQLRQEALKKYTKKNS